MPVIYPKQAGSAFGSGGQNWESETRRIVALDRKRRLAAAGPQVGNEDSTRIQKRIEAELFASLARMSPTPSGQGDPSIDVFDTYTPKWTKLGGTLRPNELKDFKVKVTAVNGPDEIYVVKADAEASIDTLNEKLDSHISGMIATKYQNYETLFAGFHEAGAFVAAKDLEGSWARGIVLSVYEDEEDGQRKLDVFFADHGDTRFGMSSKEIFPLSSEFAEMECQAIELKLGHIEPAHARGIWTRRVAKIMEEMLIREGVALTVEVVPLGKAKIGQGGDGNLNDTGTVSALTCNFYNSLVFTDMDHELGETLVRAKVALFKDEQDFYKKKETLLEAKVKIINALLEGEEYDGPDSAAGPLKVGPDGFEAFGLGD